jgi:predicted RecB family endonuclease
MNVTVASQVKQTLSSLKSAQASLESFAIETQNQMAKQLFTDAAQQTKTIINNLEPRIQDLEREEPQYRGL